MKKLFTYFSFFVPLLSMAQGGQYTGTGYYRVQNADTERYIGIVDNRAKIDGYDINLGAFFSYKGFDYYVAYNPATICYFQYASGDVNKTSKANLIGQKLNLYNVAGVYLDITKFGDGSYKLTGTRSSVSATLTDDAPNPYEEVDQARIGTTGRYMYWYIRPVNDSEGQYFGVKPDVQDGSGTYWATMYASFPYTPKAGTNTKSYTVRVADGFAVVKEITEMVGVDAPVLIRCNGATPSDNRLNIHNNRDAFMKITDMRGNWYCYNHVNKKTGERLDHWNMTAYDPSTMRMLGVAADGKPAFVKSDIEWLPANKAYLLVPAGTPDVLPIITEEEYAAWVQEREKDQVVLTANNKSRAYGDANPTFDYTVGGTGTLSGQPAITCEATATSPVGTYPILISKGTVSNYKQEYHNGVLTITQAPLTISAESYTKKQGEAMPEFTVSYAGFKNGESSNVLTKQPVVHCNATADSAPGEYPITVSGAEAQNYAISYVAGKLIVTAADPVTVTAKSYSRAYGDANPAFEYTVTGAALDGQPEISCEATATSPVGTYSIVIKKGSVKNYNDSYVNGVLTITQAPLTVTAQSYSREEGEENPPFEVIYAGWKNGENESVLTKKPVATTEATKDSAPGDYDITVGGGEAQNYSFKYVNGKLTIIESSGIATVMADGRPVNVYSLSGNLVRAKATALEGLPKGVYIVNGQKVTVK